MLKVGINGFGRIGRAVFRVNASQPRFTVVAINDLDPDVENLAYLLKYDSVYGRFGAEVTASRDDRTMMVDGHRIAFESQSDIAAVPWGKHGVDLVIDASGVTQNVFASGGLIDGAVLRKVVITHSPADGVDHTIIFGVNEESYDPDRHDVVAASICDANAIAPVLKLLDDSFGIEHGFITTLHPWLSYQNLSAGSVRSVTSPGHYWTDYSLGRASSVNLIPKQTTAMDAVRRVLPEAAARIEAISFRVPTGIVSTSDLSLVLRDRPDREAVNNLMRRQAAAASHIFGFTQEPLVSQDFLAIEQSLVVDGRWTRTNPAGGCKLVVWYDNEWGYSQRVVDMVELMARHL